MPAPSNTTPATATNIPTLATPFAQSLDVAGAPDDSTYTSTCNFNANANNVWWKYTAQPKDVAVAIRATYPGLAADYVPVWSVWVGAPDALAPPDLDNTCVRHELASNYFWLVIPVTVGTTYYIQVVNDSGGGIPAENITVEVRHAPQLAVPAGSLLINDDTDRYPAMALSPVNGATLRAFVMPASERGDNLSTGEIACKNAIGIVANPNSHLTVQDATIANPPTAVLDFSPDSVTSIRGHVSGKWYVVITTAGGHSLLKTVDTAGSIGGTSWTLTTNGADAASVACVDSAETIAYWQGVGDETRIRRHNLNTDTPMSDLVVDAAGSFGGDPDMACLDVVDDSVIVRFRPTTVGADDVVRNYSAAGALLHTYPTVPNNSTTPFFNRYHLAVDQLSVWVWLQTSTTLVSTFWRIRLADGVHLTEYTVPLTLESGLPNQADDPFACSNSCPLMLVAQPIGPSEISIVGDCTTKQLTITRDAGPDFPGSPVVFARGPSGTGLATIVSNDADTIVVQLANMSTGQYCVAVVPALP